jgi:hypothetical protein
MPLYFFDFTDGELNGCDQFGTKLPDIEAAAREAVSALANISKDVRKQYKDRVLALKVRDQSGETVLNVTLTLAVTWFPASRIELCEYASGFLPRSSLTFRFGHAAGPTVWLGPTCVVRITSRVGPFRAVSI